MITVYGRVTSSNVQAVLWGIAELDLEHERLDYGHVFGGLDNPEFRALNPHGVIPVIQDGDVVVWESCAILRYLAARYGDGEAFWPVDPAKRAAVDMWAEWGKVSFAQHFTVPIFWSRVRTAAVDRDEAALLRGIAYFETRIAALETQLSDGQAFVVSDEFSLADIIIGHVLFRWFDVDIARAPNPLVEAYFQRIMARPAYRRHVAISYEDLRVEGA